MTQSRPRGPKPGIPRGIACRARQLANEIESEGAHDDVFDTAAASTRLGCSLAFLEVRRMAKSHLKGPNFIKIGSLVGYRRADLVDWLREIADLYDAAHPPASREGSLKIIRGLRQ